MLGRQKVTIGLIAPPIIALCILLASQFIGATQIRDGMIGTDVLHLATFWVRNMGRRNERNLFFCFYLLLTSISIVIGNDPVICECSACLGEDLCH